MEKLDDIQRVEPQIDLQVTVMDEAVPAGFPSPAQDRNGDVIDLNRELIQHPASTFSFDGNT